MLVLKIVGIIIGYIVIGVLSLIYSIKIGEYNPYDEDFEFVFITILLWPICVFYLLYCKLNDFLKKIYDDMKSDENSDSQ